VLHAAAQVLLHHRCEFKFAKDIGRVVSLTSIGCSRAQAGKFITAYPVDDEQFHRVAVALCDATVGMPGPRILSDRQYRPGSIVQYRFGAFQGVPVLTNDGSLEAWLQDPDGSLVADQRKPWFSPPSWAIPVAASPNQSPAAVHAARNRGGKPVLADRFEVRRALRHSARGGVYLAADTKTGYPVLIKEARAHIGSDLRGKDGRALLAYEAKVLAELSPLTPAVVCVFDKDDHSFLVEEFVEGRSMWQHITAFAQARQPVPRSQAMALALVRLVEAVHHRGWVLRDLNTNNVMVRSDDQLILIDPEHAARPGDVVSRVFTPGFAAPETLDSPTYGPAPDPATDRFAVGAMLVHLVLGSPIRHIPDEDDVRYSIPARIRRLLLLAQHEQPLARQWWPLLTGLCEADPDRRWTLAHAADFLQAHPATGAPPPSIAMPSRSEASAIERAIEDGLDHIVSTMRPDSDWLWAADESGASSDPLSVQHGAAGVLALLERAASLGYPVASAALPVAAEWIRKRLDQAPRVLPGLYFGRAGVAWALREAADALDDVGMAAQAEELGLQLPIHWPNPDVCHGAAGAGLAQLQLWRLSGRDDFLERARHCADGLVQAASFSENGAYWQVPGGFDSVLAGACHLGFAHGVAGIGAFLLASAQASGEPRYLEMANAAGQTLASAVDIHERTGSATWRTDLHKPPTAEDLLFHWCSGASGIGSFLLRLAAAQPTPAASQRYWELIRAAALSVHEARWISSTATCHGLAGNGQFLLDAYAAAERSMPTHAGQYRQWAEDLAQLIVARHGCLQGRMVIPDDSEIGVTAAYGTGLAGVLDFLLRLQHGGRRSWMVEPGDGVLRSTYARPKGGEDHGHRTGAVAATDGG
jgi:serine/threonine protein kinase